MKIIDAHHHLWDIKIHDYPWLKKDPENPLSKNYLIDDFNEDIGELEVIKSVHVQREMNHENSLDETKWLQEVANKENSGNKPNAIVAYEDLTSSKLDTNLENQKKIVLKLFNQCWQRDERSYLYRQNVMYERVQSDGSQPDTVRLPDDDCVHQGQQRVERQRPQGRKSQITDVS